MNSEKMKEKWELIGTLGNEEDHLILEENYFDMALYSLYISEQHLTDQINFEKEVIKNNLVLHTKDQRGVAINDDDEHKLIYEA